MTTVIKFAAIGVAIYLSLLLFLYVAQRSLIYHPDATRPEPGAWNVPDMSVVSLHTSDGLSLLGWWKGPRDGRPVIAFFHGNGGHIGYRGRKVRHFLDDGFGVLLFAWRGYSGNQGKPTEDGLYADGKAALDFLEKQGFKAEQLILYGESLGSGVAVELASQGAGQALILEAPFTALADAAADRYPIFPVRRLVKDRFDSAAKIGNITVPLLIVHGENDRVLPASLGRDLLRRANQPKKGVFIPGAGHNNLYDFGAAGAVLTFLNGVYP